VGMAGRFPGARSVAEFWRNQLRGIEAIARFGFEDLENPQADVTARDGNYVMARSVLDDVDRFDAEFFSILPREAERIDPQQRLFLECCWQALEDGGYDPTTYPGSIGVYAGSSPSTYFLTRLCSKPGFIDRYTEGYQVESYPEMLGNNPDFLCTRVSYKLNLRGPSFTMLSGCSSSLIAVIQACQSLLTYQSDMALAGGASITFPQKRATRYQEGGMVSLDGHCRAFDADAQGTVFGSGVAVVLLKRLEDALSDGDQIYAVIRGFAANNDGSAKVGYTAPSIEGQARVIALAQEAAGVDAETIGYVEAHGTGTPLGDPIELAALGQVFRMHTDRKNFCALGTAKTNVGHLDIAAGVTGLIHAAHIVRTGVFPPTLHFKKPNPQFDLANSPFCIHRTVSEWKPGKTPRRAGVSAFGVGGTNAHVVIEQAPDRPLERPGRPRQLLILSARSERALDQASNNLAEHLKANPALHLADVAWTLQVGRREFPGRRVVVAGDQNQAVQMLLQREGRAVQTQPPVPGKPAIHFLFPGQGSQQVNMAREIYDSEAVFRKAVDRCAEILRPSLDVDLRLLLYPPEGASEEAKRRVTDTLIAQPAIFTIEYALAQLWVSWGIAPAAMLGHSVGEFVAACLAGVFSLEDALGLVEERGKLMQALPAGGMLSVRLGALDLRERLTRELSLAAVNSPSLSVVSGPLHALDSLEKELSREGVFCRRLETSHAFHSAMMDPILEPFSARVGQLRLHPPQIPYISGVTGTWISAKEATSPEYWAKHLREAVQFSSGILELMKNPNSVLLEVGPGNVLSTLARQHITNSFAPPVISSLSDGSRGGSDAAQLMNALGSIWLAGKTPDWNAVHAGENRQRVSLPTYPFEGKRYWLESSAPENKAQQPSSSLGKILEPKTALAPLPEESPSLQEDRPTTRTEVISPSRRTRIRQMLAEIFEGLSGIDISKSAGSTPFLEMGFDSLFLTQVTQALQGKCGLKITFRQLLGDLSTLDSLAAFVDSKGPEELTGPSSEAQETAPAELPLPPATHSRSVPEVPLADPIGIGEKTMSESSLERLLREQLEAMNQLFARQLQAIRDTSSLPIEPGIRTTADSTPAIPVRLEKPQALPPAAHVTSRPIKAEFQPFGPYKPPAKGISTELTERQKRGLQSLIDRYTERTPQSKSFTEKHRPSLADPRVVAGFRSLWKELVYPIVTERSEGSRLWDIDGNEYIDLLNGFGPIFLGHRPPFVTAAIREQLEKGFEIGPQTPLAGEVAELLCEMTGNERMTFCNTGSEAVMAALRVARTITARKKIALFANAYHGMFDEVLVKGFKRSGVPHSVPIAPGIPQEKVENILVLDYGTKEALELIRQNAKDLAAVLLEPVQSRHPEIVLPDYLEEIRKITETSGTALIFDEVVTGFRVHPGGCQALFGIRADLVTYGKVVAGGMPIGILAGKAKYMDALDGGAWQFGDDSYPEVGVTFFAGTFVRHPLALAAVKAVLEHLREQGPELQERVNERTGQMVRAINRHLERNSVPTRIANFKSLCYFSFPSEERFASLFYYYLRLKGIHILEGFPCFLTTAHTDADIEKVIRGFEESVAEMQEAGFFPEPAEKMTPHAPLASLEQSISGPDSSPAEAIPGPPEVPLTESQMEVWLSAELSEEASCAFNESFTMRIHGPLHEGALQDSLLDLVNRHEALRARFHPDGESIRFSPHAEVEIPIEDLSRMSPSDRSARLQAYIEREAHQPFDLRNGPMVRLRLFRLEEEESALVFTTHHIVCDGWSTNVLLEELGKLYTARATGRPSGLSQPVPFSDYAREEARSVGSRERSEVEAYWVKQFEEPPPALELPTDRPRARVKSFKGSTFRAHIDLATCKQIQQAGARQGCTLFVTLFAGFASLLYRLTSQEDIVVGIPTAGQSLLEDGRLVGHCVNFLPLRARISENQSAAELLQQLKRSLLDAYEHQAYTYGTLVRRLKLYRDPSRLPLLEVQFNLEKVGARLHLPGLDVEVDSNPKAAVNFDLFLNIVESSEGLAIDCDYNTDLFDRETVGHWLALYETLLKEMAADSTRAVSALPLLSEAERHQALVRWNQTEAEYPRSKTVRDLIEEQVAETPDAVALIFENQSLTYAELDCRANQLAHRLLQTGVKPGMLVGISVERSFEMMVGLLGIWKAGAAYLPLDPAYPEERLSFILKETSLSVLVTQANLLPSLPENNCRVVCLDREGREMAQAPKSNPRVNLNPNDLAYVIYTSGSTGKPKGVEITHRNFVNLLWSMRREPGIEARDRLLAVTTLSFDIAGLELFLPLLVGAQVVLASREAAVDGRLLLKLLLGSRATVMQATPSTWRMLLEIGWRGTPGLKILCGGEALPRDLADRLVTSGALWNLYGPTETTIWSATSRVEAGTGPVSLGHPIHNTQFYVLDKTGQPVPIGVPGELFIGGDGVARGYFARPELTRERFVADPFNAQEDSRLYRTGDWVRYHLDGRLEFLGRMDTQVKVRGFRIELGEIESVLGRHPRVREVAVAVREDSTGKRLVAYVAVDEASQPSSDDLRGWIERSLPEYMIPSLFFLLPALPHTPNGKVDRKALAAREGRSVGPSDSFVAPRNSREEQLAAICREVLQIPRVGIHDSLFDLGADSIHVFQIIARAGRAGLLIKPAQLLRLHTVARVAAEIGGDGLEDGKGRSVSLPEIVPVPREPYRIRPTPRPN
jgi:amino acid adenylation domain-containing protein